MKVDIGPDSITILDEDGNELVHWIEDEWIEDPSVVISIVNAVVLACANSNELLCILRGDPDA